MESSTKGSLTMDLQGNIVSSEGALAESKIGSTILRMLEETNNLLTNESKSAFKRITVSFKNYEYLVTLDKMRIYVYLRDREASESE